MYEFLRGRVEELRLGAVVVDVHDVGYCVVVSAPTSEALESGRQVKLSGFGNFDLRNKNERPGRNPKTGEEIPITARRVVTFRPGQKLKARVEAYAGSEQQ